MPKLTKLQKKQLKKQFKRNEVIENRNKLCLSVSELIELLDFLDDQLSKTPCDHSLNHMKQWARIKNIDWQEMASGLEEFGAFCDCEILFNIDPENFILSTD